MAAKDVSLSTMLGEVEGNGGTAAAAPPSVAPPVAPLWGELRYGSELARLIARRALSGELLRGRRAGAAPVLLIPGFMAGDSSLAMLRSWLRRRGHEVSMSGLRINAGCAEEIVSRLQEQLCRRARRLFSSQ